jgi:hypothetical protein
MCAVAICSQLPILPDFNHELSTSVASLQPHPSQRRHTSHNNSREEHKRRIRAGHLTPTYHRTQAIHREVMAVWILLPLDLLDTTTNNLIPHYIIQTVLLTIIPTIGLHLPAANPLHLNSHELVPVSICSLLKCTGTHNASSEIDTSNDGIDQESEPAVQDSKPVRSDA